MKEKFLGIGQSNPNLNLAYSDITPSDLPESLTIRKLRFVIFGKNDEILVRNLEFGCVATASDGSKAIIECTEKVSALLSKWPLSSEDQLKQQIEKSFYNKTSARDRLMDNYLFNRTTFLLESQPKYYATKYLNIIV